MKTNVLFLGFSDPGCDVSYYQEHGYSIWTMNDYYRHWTNLRPDRVFEIHSAEAVDNARQLGRYPGDHRKIFNDSGAQIITSYFQGFENEMIFPLEMALEKFGPKFFVSTVSYMFALAIMENWALIQLHGCHFSGINDHAQYIPGTLRNIDAARARNIVVHVEPDLTGPEIVYLEHRWREQSPLINEDWKGVYG